MPSSSPARVLSVAYSASTASGGSVAVSSASTTTPLSRAALKAPSKPEELLGVTRMPLAPLATRFWIAVIWPSLSPSYLPASASTSTFRACPCSCALWRILTKNGFVSVFVIRPMRILPPAAAAAGATVGAGAVVGAAAGLGAAVGCAAGAAGGAAVGAAGVGALHAASTSAEAPINAGANEFLTRTSFQHVAAELVVDGDARGHMIRALRGNHSAQRVRGRWVYASRAAARAARPRFGRARRSVGPRSSSAVGRPPTVTIPIEHSETIAQSFRRASVRTPRSACQLFTQPSGR